MDIEIITKLIGTGAVLFCFGSLACVKWYERKIEQLHAELEKKIEYEKSQPVSMQRIDGKIERIKDMYKPKIARLKRKRQYILDKLPFIRR